MICKSSFNKYESVFNWTKREFMNYHTDVKKNKLVASGKKVIACYLRVPSRMDTSEEFKFLIESAGYNLVEFYLQSRYPTSAFYFGEGFWSGLHTDLENSPSLKDVDTIIIGTQLTPLQNYRITQKLENKKIMDEFELILEIFSQRAHTQEAELQIELARLNYQLPFVKNRLTQQRVSGERLGFMQAGELKIAEVESSYRRVETKIKSKLEKIKQQRISRRKLRAEKAVAGEFLTISLVGYTNAGKSSLLNSLTQATVDVANQLFTTLTTTTRRFQFDDLPVLLTDTVGFFEDLPATLIDAFKSTLEESLNTDFIAILIDISESQQNITRKLKTSIETLNDIEAGINDHIFLFLNKSDLLTKDQLQYILEWFLEEIKKYVGLNPTNICIISALQHNFESLYTLLDRYYPLKLYQISIPFQYPQYRSKLYSMVNVVSENLTDNVSWSLIIKTRRPKALETYLQQLANIDLTITYLILK